MEGIHIPAMPDPQLLGRDRAGPGSRESSARLTPEPGQDEVEGGGHPGGRDHFRSHEFLVPDMPHRGGWLRGIPAPLPPAEEGSAQAAPRAAALLLPPPSPGKPQPPGLGEVLKT